MKSSGALWTTAEDERLHREVLALVEKFEGRSLAAVLSRIDRNRVKWGKQQVSLKSKRKTWWWTCVDCSAQGKVTDKDGNEERARKRAERSHAKGCIRLDLAR